jgi:hypothetical protein
MSKKLEQLYPEIAEKNFDDMSKEYIALKRDLEVMKSLIRAHGLESELDARINLMSAEEQICIDGINGLAKLFENSTFTKDDAATFDILNKNLRLIRGQSADVVSKKNKKNTKAELFSIVEEAKKRG